MSYEIREDRLVTSNGRADDDEHEHYAVVEGDGGKLRIRLAPYSAEIGFIRPEISMSDGEVGFETKDLIAALRDLARLAGLDTPDEAYSTDMERVAQVVERVCVELESDHNPVRESLATDLRTTVLALAGRQVS